MSAQSHLSRREFLQTAAVAGAAAAAAGTLSPFSATPAVAQTPASKPAWMTPPAPIAAKDIKETVTADVVVVGGGVSGFCAAISAKEKGAKVVLLEKWNTPVSHGGWNGVLNSRLQKKLGITVDRDEIINEHMRWSGYLADQRLVTLWADKSGEVMDWLLDKADAAKLEVRVETDVKYGESFKYWPIAHNWPKAQADLIGMLLKDAQAKGVDIRFETAGTQLLRQGKGRVTGVVAQTKAGEYKQFNAAKAVILCTGCYANNKEMVNYYFGWRGERLTAVSYVPATATGDGHKMGLWVGAAIDEAPHCPMLFDGATIAKSSAQDNLVRQPFLNVNTDGERFVNEDLPYAYTNNADLLQPGAVKWVVFDSKWPSEVERIHGTVCERMVPSPSAPLLLHNDAASAQMIKDGAIISANTIDELAQKMKVPVETFKATVARYNEIVRNGRDVDFGKRTAALTSVEKAPLYASLTGVRLLVALGGLKINTSMQVLDTDRKVIPGLYAAGNTSGGFFANDYPINVCGVSHGRALTFGRLAGLAAAAEKAA